MQHTVCYIKYHLFPSLTIKSLQLKFSSWRSAASRIIWLEGAKTREIPRFHSWTNLDSVVAFFSQMKVTEESSPTEEMMRLSFTRFLWVRNNTYTGYRISICIFIIQSDNQTLIEKIIQISLIATPRVVTFFAKGPKMEKDTNNTIIARYCISKNRRISHF